MTKNCVYYVPDMDVSRKGYCIFEEFSAHPHHPIAIARAIFHPQLNPVNEPVPVIDMDCMSNGKKCRHYIPAISLHPQPDCHPEDLQRAC